jgi:hypothetical protein
MAMPDVDCDGAVDMYDNCPHVQNSDQSDTNRNGVGDVCDILVEEIELAPDNVIRQGESTKITLRLYNNRPYPLEDISLGARNAELNMNEVKHVDMLPPGKQMAVDFQLRIPACAPVGNHVIVISSALRMHGDTSSDVQHKTIQVQQGTACKEPVGSLDTTTVGMLDAITIDRGENAIIPITVTNDGADEKIYSLLVQGADTLGTWSIDPASLTVKGRSAAKAYVSVQTSAMTPPGQQKILIVIVSQDRKESIPVTISVRAPIPEEQKEFPQIFQYVLLVAVILLIIAALFIASRKPKRPAVTATGEKMETHW